MPRTRATHQGVSLIEILVVLVILGVVSSLLVLSIGAADGSARVRAEAIRLAQRLDYACERAELGGRTIGLAVNPGGYAFFRHDDDQWLTENDRALSEVKLPKGMQLDDGAPNVRRRTAPSIHCFASGERTPFRLVLSAGATDDRFRLSDDWPRPTRIERQPADQSVWTPLAP